MKKKIFNRKPNETGQSMVELGLSLVILLLLLSGVVDLGRLAFYYIAMKDAAQEGASYGSIFPNDCDEIEKRTIAGPFDPSKIEVTLRINGEEGCKKCPYEYNPGELIEITVRDPKFQTTMPLFTHEINLETTIQDNIIRVPLCPVVPEE